MSFSQNKTIKIKCPAKINLNLKVINKRSDGFHNIESVMQAISLFDYLTISVTESETLKFELSGSSDSIPYDETNLVYKAAKLYCDVCNISNIKLSVYIEKNIPVSAGLAGGSTDAAGMLFGLNVLCGNKLDREELLSLCSRLGSDLNFCLQGGCMMTSGRGEITENVTFKKRTVNLIKPMNLGISAKEAYTKFSHKLSLNPKSDTRDEYVNDLEWAVIDDYQQLQFIKNKYPSAVMTGSGSTYYSFEEEFEQEENCYVQNGLQTIPYGICQV